MVQRTRSGISRFRVHRCAMPRKDSDTHQQKKRSPVLLRRDRAGLPANPRQPHRASHQGRGALQGQEHPARGTALRAALSGHAAAQPPDPARLRFRGKKLRAADAQRSAGHCRHRKEFRRAEAAPRQDQRLSENLQAGAVRRRRRARRDLPGGADQHDAEGPAVRQRRCLPEFLLPRRHRPRHPRHNGVEVGKRDFLGV